jgi:tripartite-type tricarboxylate transporter receptor subunit TctC
LNRTARDRVRFTITRQQEETMAGLIALGGRIAMLAGLLALCAANAAPAAAAYPDRPVRLIVPYAAGGPTDIAARLIASELGQRMGQSFVVENRAGAGGNIGAEEVARAPADGYTLLVIGAAHAINRTLYSKLNYDVKRDFTPVATFSTAPLILLANAHAGIDSVAALVARARAQPGKLNYCSAGSGTAPHLAMEWLKSAAGIDLVHVPYKGSTPCITDTIAGQVELCFDSLVVWRQYAASGKLVALAVTGKSRSAIAPAVPTMGEAGYPQVDASVWYGIAGPAGMPAAAVQALNDQVRQVLADPAVKQRLASLGAEPLVKSPLEFKAFMDAELDSWAKVVKASGAHVD